MIIKICNKCKTEKISDEFCKDKRNPVGLGSICLNCQRIKSKQYRKSNKEKIKIYRDSIKEKQKLYNQRYRQENKEKLSSLHKIWFLNNKKRKYKSNHKWMLKKYHNDPVFKLRQIISVTIRRTIKNNLGVKGSATWKNLPYTSQQLKQHIESLWEPWMNWGNYGCKIGNWSIDHITPQSKLPYDSFDHPNFLECWKLENLRPLGVSQNIKRNFK